MLIRRLLPIVLGFLALLLVNANLALAAASQDNLPSRLAAPTPPPVITVAVPILTYHGVGSDYSINVSTRTLTAQMDYLQQHGYTSVSIDQVAAALRGEGELPPRPVALTFDDGWSAVYTNALPILQAHGFRATFFVVAGCSSGRSRAYLSWDQIRSLRDAGMWIGSHSISHPNLNGLGAAALWREVAESKRLIEEHIGGPVTVFAYPYGALSPRVIQAVQNAGYVAAVGVSPSVRQSSDRILRLSRITASGAMGMAQFEAFLTGRVIAPRVPAPRPQAPAHVLSPNCHHLACDTP